MSARNGYGTSNGRPGWLGPQDPGAFQVVLDDIRADMGDRLAAIALLGGDGTIVAASGQPSTVVAAQERGRVTGRDTALAREWRAGREVVFVVFPCRCSLPRQPADRAEGSRTVRPASRRSRSLPRQSDRPVRSSSTPRHHQLVCRSGPARLRAADRDRVRFLRPWQAARSGDGSRETGSARPPSAPPGRAPEASTPRPSAVPHRRLAEISTISSRFPVAGCRSSSATSRGTGCRRRC